jgi:YesN/AraC family two-component response regulator
VRRNYQFITLKDLAKDFHFHENYLSRMIKQQCQVSFRELLCQIRLKEAERLLIDTELSVTVIAERVGYHKTNFFFKLFKEHYKMTPIEFRNNHIT